MADVFGTPLDFEINRFLTGKVDREMRVRAIIRAGEKDINPIKVVRLDVSSDFEDNYKDEMSVTIAMPMGDVIHDIGPFQDDLKITLIEERYEDGMYVPRPSEYRAYLLQEIPKRIVSSNSPAMNSRGEANSSEIMTVGFSLEPVVMEYIDNSSTGTIVKSVAPHSVLTTLFANVIDSIVVNDDERITAIDMYQPSNVTPKDQMIIPHHTPIVELPDLLQSKLGGIYSTGLGFYIQNQVVYFWPLYDTKRISINSKKLQVILSPTRHFKASESTTIIDNDTVAILGTGPIEVFDDTLGDINKGGDSVRYLDAGSAIGGFGKTVDNHFIADRAGSNSEMSTVKTGSGITRARQGAGKVTSNVFEQASKLAQRDGIRLTVVWRNSDRNLLIPGMVTTIIYYTDGEVREASGVLLSCISSIEMIGKGLVEGSMVNTSVLTVFIDRNDPIFADYVEAGGSPTVFETQ